MLEIHKELLRNFKKLKELLDENNISYMAIGGTAIGAMRESGFIAWDDDIDIIVPEEQYDKFIELIKMQEGMSLFNKYGVSPTPFYKVYFDDVNIKFRGVEDHLFIDVFKGYKKREVGKAKKAYLTAVDYLLHIKAIKMKHMHKSQGWMFTPAALLIKMLPLTTKRLFKMYDKSISKSKIIDEDKRRSYFLFMNHDNIWVNFKDAKEYKFEDTSVPVDRNFAEVLKPVYGDIYKPHKTSDMETDHGIEIIR